MLLINKQTDKQINTTKNKTLFRHRGNNTFIEKQHTIFWSNEHHNILCSSGPFYIYLQHGKHVHV